MQGQSLGESLNPGASAYWREKGSFDLKISNTFHFDIVAHGAKEIKDEAKCPPKLENPVGNPTLRWDSRSLRLHNKGELELKPTPSSGTV